MEQLTKCTSAAADSRRLRLGICCFMNIYDEDGGAFCRAAMTKCLHVVVDIWWPSNQVSQVFSGNSKYSCQWASRWCMLKVLREYRATEFTKTIGMKMNCEHFGFS